VDGLDGWMGGRHGRTHQEHTAERKAAQSCAQHRCLAAAPQQDLTLERFQNEWKHAKCPDRRASKSPNEAD